MQHHAHVLIAHEFAVVQGEVAVKHEYRAVLADGIVDVPCALGGSFLRFAARGVLLGDVRYFQAVYTDDPYGSPVVATPRRIVSVRCPLPDGLEPVVLVAFEPNHADVVLPKVESGHAFQLYLLHYGALLPEIARSPCPVNDDRANDHKPNG